MIDHTEIEVDGATVVTAIPYTEGTEYREYEVDGEELALFLGEIEDPQVSERVVDVELHR